MLAGTTPFEVLKIATWNGAKYSQVLERTGAITAGKDADLILVDGDPSKNISDIRRVNLLMRSGASHFPSEIYSALGVKPFVAATCIADNGNSGRGKIIGLISRNQVELESIDQIMAHAQKINETVTSRITAGLKTGRVKFGK